MIFLTGASGFVGSALLNYYHSVNAPLIALLRDSNTVLSGGAQMLEADLSLIAHGNLASQPLRSKFHRSLKNCDVVIHAAARAHVMHEKLSDPLDEYRKINCGATLALARLAAEAGVKRFVFISSIKVSGEFTDFNKPFIDEVDGVPEDPYGLSKYEAEQGLLKIAEETGMEVVIIRPPLVYGPNPKGNFASLVKWVKKGIPLPFGSVRNQRSFVALDNLVDFIVLCADREKSPKAANEVFLISDGEDVSTPQLLQKVAKAYGVPSRLIPIPVSVMTFTAKVLGRGLVADRLFGNLKVDSSKALDLLGWKPVVNMDQQLAKMAEFDAGRDDSIS